MKNLLFTLIVLLCAAPCLSADGVDGIRPAPDSVTLLKGSFRMSGAAFKYSSSLDSTAREAVQALASRLSLVCGKTSPVSSPVGLDGAAASGAVKGMIFLIDEGMSEEAYSLDIQPGTAVVRAGGTAGILHSVQSGKAVHGIFTFFQHPGFRCRALEYKSQFLPG